MSKPQPQAPERGKKSRHPIAWTILIVCLIIMAVIVGYFLSIVGQLRHHELDPNDLGITPDHTAVGDAGVVDDADDRSITNVALFGIDQRKGDTQFRADAIIIASVDKLHNKIKLSSMMRDTYVAIDGHGMNKLGHAYFYGGPQLAVKTLNQNFGLDIREYVTVNFAELASIIDAVGGVEIDVSEAERKSANNSIWEQVKVADLAPTPIEKAGLQNLNGTQAVAYARIRHVGNADFDRTNRQREVLGKLFEKALAMNPIQYPEFARKFLPTVETSLGLGQILNLGGIMLRDVTLEDARFPTNADLIGSGSLEINGVQYLNADLDAIKTKLHAFIYNDVSPTASEGAATASK